MLQIIAKTLYVADEPGRPLFDRLADALAEKQVLLVQDNCEYAFSACAQIVRWAIEAGLVKSDEGAR